MITDKKKRAVAIWLLVGVGMLVIQILLGGVTRLTGSGLSITEWKPIHGAVPPMNQAAWQEEFSNYQQKAAGQFNYNNRDFTLSDFKSIYWWEWMHREWARLVGVVFLIGFVFFLVKRYFTKEMVLPMIVLFVLGGLQGLIGWIMVKSGLNPEDTHVNHIKLALHFMAALVLISYTWIFALQLLTTEKDRVAHPPLFRLSVIIISLLAVQLCYGAFMAGLKAASAAPTWPTINGVWTPGDLHHFGNQTFSGLRLWADNPIAVHLVHRTLAYLILGLVVAWFVYVRKARNITAAFRRASGYTLFFVLLQACLGIFTVLSAGHIVPQHFGQFEWLAEAHQLVAMCLLLSLVTDVYLLRRKLSH